MNFKRLEYFVVVGQTGHLRQASEILRISPPALSKAMRVLEEEIGIKLWVREGRKMILTEKGQRFLKKAPRLLDEFRNTLDSLQTQNEGPKPVRIGTFDVFSTYFLSFMDKIGWTHHSLELHQLLPGELERFLNQGEIDYGITYMPVPDPGLDFFKVASIEMGVYRFR